MDILTQVSDNTVNLMSYIILFLSDIIDIVDLLQQRETCDRHRDCHEEAFRST